MGRPRSWSAAADLAERVNCVAHLPKCVMVFKYPPHHQIIGISRAHSPHPPILCLACLHCCSWTKDVVRLRDAFYPAWKELTP